MSEICPALISFFICSLFVLGLAIPTVYYGYEDEDNICQEGKRAGMILSDWVKITGFNYIAMTAFGYVMLLLCVLSDVFVMFAIAVYILELFFYIALWIIGIVILSTNENNNCVAEGTGIAVIAIINLVIGEISFVYLQTFLLLTNQ